MTAPFFFRGTLPASKSILLRLLVIQSYAPQDVRIEGDSRCDDVRLMKAGLKNLALRHAIDCDQSAAVFRFLALRAARQNGTLVFHGSPRLFARPITPLIALLHQLGSDAAIGSQPPCLTARARGWTGSPNPLIVDTTFSSQFASALLLNAWNLSAALSVELRGESVSRGYLALTIDLLRRAGMDIDERGTDRIMIREHQYPRAGSYAAEIDLSSAFVVAALAAVAGKARIEHFPPASCQPDVAFVDILQRMGTDIKQDGSSLTISKKNFFEPGAWNLKDVPDLFPVLAVLCSLAAGRSVLVGASQLVHKESDRIAGVARLLTLLGKKAERREDGLVIHGARNNFPRASIAYDPQGDHRLAMAAAVARAAGAPITILHPDVVNKSFPEFWEIADSGL